MDNSGLITGFSYVIWLTGSAWRAAAKTRQAFFSMTRGRQARAAGFVVHLLLTPGCLELPDIIAAALTKRATNIRLGSCLADEWLLRLGEDGFAGWIARALELGERVSAPSRASRG